MRRICVVYLARAVNGIAPFEQFLRSYRQFPAGADHDLAIMLKGFTSDAELKSYNELIVALGAKSMKVGDGGFDIRAYRKAALTFGNPYFCFLNSFSVILTDDWLAKLFSALSAPAVGLVGATASAESMFTNVLIEQSRFNNPTILRRLWTPVRLRLCKACFEPFPNYHLRTNGILISRDLLLKVWPRRVITKRGAYLFENGKNSLTQRVLRMNLDVRLVGRDGRSFRKEEWSRSNTFRLGKQENLLVADNQTRQYENADDQTRKYLTNVAWGPDSSICATS